MNSDEAIRNIRVGDRVSLPRMMTVIETADGAHTENIEEGREAIVVEVDYVTIVVEFKVSIAVCFGEVVSTHGRFHRLTFAGERRSLLKKIRIAQIPLPHGEVRHEIGGW